MRALVTGATGFVGTRVMLALARAGYALTATSRDADRAKRLLPEGTRVVAWDAKGDLPASALDDVTVVVHLLGESVAGRWTKAHKETIRASRVDATLAVARAIAAAPKPPALVSASAIGFYGDRGEEELDESKGPGEGFLTDVCVAWEEATRPARDAGARVVLARIGLVLGKGGGALGSMLPIFKMGGGGKLGPGTQWWPWIEREDAAGYLAHLAAHSDASGPVNVVAPAPIRQADFAKTLGKVLRRPTFVPTPAFALRAMLGEFSTELLSSRRVVPGRAAKLGWSFRSADLREALSRSLG